MNNSITSDQQFSVNAIMGENKNVVDGHILKNNKVDESTVEHDDNGGLTSVVIIGDIISNDINPTISKHRNIPVKFSWGSGEAMKNYINPTIRLKPDAVIIHAGTNDMNSNSIARSM